MKAAMLDRSSLFGRITAPIALAAAAASLGLALAWGLHAYGLRFGAILIVAGASVAAAGVMLSRPPVGAVALVLVLASFPVARLGVGAAPIYISDVVLVLVLVGLAQRRALRVIPPAGLLLIFILSWIPSWFYEATSVGTYLEPTYGIARDTLAVGGGFLAGAWVGRHPAVARRVLVGLAVGTIVTSVIALLQYAPGSASTVRQFLESAAPAFAPRDYLRYPDRAFAFFQAPTTLAGFLSVMTALLAGGIFAVQGRSRLVLAAALVLLGPALIVTYSRQWVPALLIGLIVLVVVLRPPGLRRILIALTLVLAVGGVAVAGGAIDGGRLVARFRGEQGADKNVQTRLELQRQFFRVTAQGGFGSIAGHGSSSTDLVDRQLVDSLAAQRLSIGVSENSVLLEFFNHGLAAGALFLAVLALVIGRGLATARRIGRQAPESLGLVIALVVSVVLMVQDRYFTAAIFMKTLLWLLVGWMAALTYLELDDDAVLRHDS